MRGPIVALFSVTLSLAWLVFFGAGIRVADLDAALLFLGATAFFYWIFRSGQTPPRVPLWYALALWALPLYAALQLIPLPPPVLESLSSTRAVIADSLGGVIPNLSREPLSVAPAAALFCWFTLIGYLTAFSLLRDLGWRFIDSNPWVPVAPLALIATIEAGFGLLEWLSGGPNSPLLGTFSNTEHFAALLEIALPFTLVFGFISFRRHQTLEAPSLLPASLAGAAWGASLLMLLAIFHLSSPASSVAVGASLFILLALAIVPRLKTKKLRWYGAGGAATLAIVALLTVTPPADFVESLARLGAGSQPEKRLTIWTNSANLLSDFRWFGAGPGGFESTFLKYQGSNDLSKVEDPGNDALSVLISFGIVGFAIVLVVLAGIFRPAIAGALFLTDEPRRLLAVAITASLSAILLRSAIEASLSVPAIAMAFAWLAGLSQSSGLE